MVKIEYSYQHGGYEGALLYLPYKAEREIISRNQMFANYMVTNYPAWQAYLKKTGQSDGGRNSPTLVLVRGYIKAPQWAIVAFKSEARTTGGTLKGGFYTAEGQVGWQFSEISGMFRQYNYGPEPEDTGRWTMEGEPPPAEERIFLSYYKIKYRWYKPWAPSVMEAAAGPDQLPPPDPAGEEGPGVMNEEYYEVETESPPIPVSG